MRCLTHVSAAAVILPRLQFAAGRGADVFAVISAAVTAVSSHLLAWATIGPALQQTNNRTSVMK